jgi:hypothetical protein
VNGVGDYIEMLAQAILKAVEDRARLLVYLYDCGNDVKCIKEACMDAAYDVTSVFKLPGRVAEKIAERVVHKFVNN